MHLNIEREWYERRLLQAILTLWLFLFYSILIFILVHDNLGILLKLGQDYVNLHP